MSLNVRYEELNKGPVVRNRTPDAIAIVDYDGTTKVWYPPVDLDDPAILIAKRSDINNCASCSHIIRWSQHPMRISSNLSLTSMGANLRRCV